MIRQTVAVLCLSVLVLCAVPWNDYYACTVGVTIPTECESGEDVNALQRNLTYEIIRSVNNMCCLVAERLANSELNGDTFTDLSCATDDVSGIMKFSVHWKTTGKPKLRCTARPDSGLGDLADATKYGVMWRVRRPA
uniref:Uncharacterized protein n=1 Tax=Plectus sambesii TaxID=2011161 RepID=A0A914X9L1_9BILA